jgi:hypothetical protein
MAEPDPNVACAETLAIIDGKTALLPDKTNYWLTFFVLGLDHGR